KSLLQALRYYDWCIENRAWLSHAFKTKTISPRNEPRLMLIAPDFSESIKRLAKYLSFEVELYRYQGIQLPSGEREVICNQVFYEERPETPRISTIQESTGRVQEETLRNLCMQILQHLEQRGFTLQPRGNDTVSGFYKGKRLIRLYPRKTVISIRVLMEDNSFTKRIRIQDNEAWETFVREYLEPRLSAFNDN
ncbi:MAG: hypothetical protein WC749_12055, partial [Dehalococcoidia bacterium]